MPPTFDQEIIHTLVAECTFSSARSSGAGGQNVNKVNTKVELRFRVSSSTVFDENQKEKLQKRLANRINNDGELVLSSQESRSQSENKELVIGKFVQLLTDALKEKKKRKPTKPTKTSILKRLEAKKRQSDIKQMRKKL